MNRTWSSSSNANHQYETIIAAEILDPAIKKVILSNDDMSLTTRDEIKESATFFRELAVEDGYVVHYEVTDADDTTAYVFRLVDEVGNIVYTGR
ncbi:hypothetical protein IDH44_23165 [Paenibacillus sp. IB182496]|uniref:Uncharacterized protein n=1 Tax=Paenibacillus sabuli TaxID=2772509 RepID=A0A927BZF0_9BACL|nr:hypothetical protein [Paenibacillus sabuli]MBD2848108.1 hypothetical protein [Paenibacillus sabuli]